LLRDVDPELHDARLGFALVARADDYLEYFRRVPMFSTCSKKDLKTVASNAERISVPAGRILVEQGQTGREAFVIVDGTARVLRNGRKIGNLGPGQMFGELALLDRAPRNATVIADTDMELLVLGQREFMEMVDATPAFARALLVGIARRINAAESRYVG
jgi:CRP-like cAMP-binding protein